MQSGNVIYGELIELHRLLIAEARGAYERSHGTTTPGELLDLLVNHDTFAWLKPFTALLVEHDEQSGIEDDWADRVRSLLRPDAAGGPFQQHYDELLQESPELAVAHGAVMRALRPASAEARA